MMALLIQVPSSEEEYNEGWKARLDKRSFKTPDAKEHYDGDLQATEERTSLEGRTLQVIFKLSNIILSPEKPEYPGGRWHIEGLC